MAFQTEIELRVKVIDKELRDLEKRAEKIQRTNPFSASGGRVGVSQAQKQTSALKSQRAELQLIEKATKQQSVEQIKLLNKRTAWLKVLKEGKQISKDIAAATEKEAKAAAKVAANRKKDRNKAIGSAASGAIISAAFPILTGGGAAESILGGAGGLLGSLAGPLGSFAGGIGGSALGRIITDAEELNKSLARLNTSIGAVGTTAQITGDDLTKLANQLGIAKDETITLIEQFNGLAAAAEIAALARDFGNVGGASTAEAIAIAAQDEVQALNAIEKLRGIIGLEAAQQLQDTLEQKGVQTTIAGILDTVLKLNQDIAVAQAEQVTFADRLKSVWSGISDIILGIDGFKTPGQIAQDRVDGLEGPDGKDRLGDLRSFLEQQRRLRDQYKPQKTPRGRAGGALPQSKELQLRQQILKTELSLSEIERKRAALQFTDLGATRAKQRALQESLPKQIQILELQRQQALTASKVPEDNILINQLYDERLNKIVAENSLLLEQNRIREQQIVLQRDLVALRNEQQTGGIVEGLERGIEDANSRSSSEMLSLRIKQLRRQEDLIGDINDKLEIQKKIEASGDAEKSEAATREIGFLEDRKAAIEALLPALNQAEQQQLRFNQAFAAVTPAVNSLVGGLREVVAGTKTAEEAFADFLTTIADQLINTAATMIAQYIAIGIARMFAMGQNPGSGGGGGGGGGRIGGVSGLGGSVGFAEGGFVTGPTNALIGEAGENEYVIPASKMSEAMGRYSAGSRGESVIPGKGGSSGGAGGGADGSTIVNYNGPTLKFNSEDYVPASAVPEIINAAAKRGAKEGEQRTFTALMNSRSQRSRIGL